MKIKKINILIVGSEGYIGSRLCKYLIEKNISLETIDLENNLRLKNIRHTKDDFKNLKINYLKKFKYILVLASHSSIAMCNNDPIRAIENNILNTKELLHKINKTSAVPIFVSTTAIYNGSNTPSEEDNSKFTYNPNQLYDISKYYIEKLLIRIFNKYFILRLGTVSGYSPNTDKRLIVNKMYYNSINEKKINIVSGKSKKSLLFIDDFCRAIESIIKSKKIRYGMFNLNSINTTVEKVAKSISKINNTKIIYKKGINFYSFFTSNKKFSKYYNFKFSKKLSIIIKSFNKK